MSILTQSDEELDIGGTDDFEIMHIYCGKCFPEAVGNPGVETVSLCGKKDVSTGDTYPVPGLEYCVMCRDITTCKNGHTFKL